jgi:hypothetical protein
MIINHPKTRGKILANVEYGNFTGNSTLFKWFKILNDHFKVQGSAFMFWKPRGSGPSAQITEDQALKNLMQGLKSEN